MANDIKLYDTVKDKKGNRFRVVEMRGEGGHVIASLKGINGDGTTKRGMPRRVAVDELEKKYTRVNLPEVTVRKIDDLSEGKHANAKEPAPKAKPAQIEEQTVRALSEEEVEEALTASTFGGEKEKPQPHTLNDTFAAIREKQLLKDLDVLKVECADLKEENETIHTELADRIQECINLKERLARSIEEREKADRTVAEQMKTISKMQQAHEAEVVDLKDRLMEKDAECNAAKKRKDEILKERTEYANAMDDDSVAFEEILSLAILMERGAKSMHEVSKMIQAKTEGRV